MSTTIDIRELAARWDEALALVSSGVDVILTEGETPRARLVPCPPGPQRIPGLHPHAIQPELGFDAPLPDDFWAGPS